MDEKLENAINELKSRRISLPVTQYLPDDIVIDNYENEIHLSFPDDYRFFLKSASDSLYNGKGALRLTPNKDHPRELRTALYEAREIGLPSDWLPICEDNSDYYCIAPDGKIRFWDHNGTSDESWPDLATWIKVVWLEGN